MRRRQPEDRGPITLGWRIEGRDVSARRLAFPGGSRRLARNPTDRDGSARSTGQEVVAVDQPAHRSCQIPGPSGPVQARLECCLWKGNGSTTGDSIRCLALSDTIRRLLDPTTPPDYTLYRRHARRRSAWILPSMTASGQVFCNIAKDVRRLRLPGQHSLLNNNWTPTRKDRSLQPDDP